MALAEIRQALMTLLARREYSRAELEQRLATRFDHDLLAQVLTEFQQKGYQSDERYAQMLVRSCIARRYGWQKLHADSFKKGLNKDLVQAAVDEQRPDWFALAAAHYDKKYASALPIPDPKTHQRRIRHLLGRGFSYEQACYACDSDRIATELAE